MKDIFKSKTVVWLIISLFAFLFSHILSSFDVIHGLQYKTVDTFFSLRGPLSPPDTNIVIIAIDDESLASLPAKYPFPTDYYTRLVENLSKAGVRQLLFDIEFTEPNITYPERDLNFARAISKAEKVVLAGKLVFDIGSHETENTHVLKPIAPLLRSGAEWGFVNVVEDQDGFIRRYMLFYQVGPYTQHSLGVKAVSSLIGKPVPEQDLYSRQFRIGSHTIPKVSANTMYINYAGPPQTFRTYSLASVLDDSTFDLVDGEDTDIFELHKGWDTFQDKIVLVGATAEELQDNKYTPFFQYDEKKQKMPGVEMHANAISTILTDRYLRDIHWGGLLIFVIVGTLAITWLTLSLRPFKALGLLLLMIPGYLVMAYMLFSMSNLIVPVLQPNISVMFAFVTTSLYQTVQEQREKFRIRRTFQQYVAPPVVEKMLSTGELPTYGGERRELSILFSDIRRFSSYSESHAPEDVVHRLSEHFTAMVDVIFQFNGTLDKFVGDEIMALFGAPYYFDNHAERACWAALEMNNKLDFMNSLHNGNPAETFRIGVGINSGRVIVGNLGSTQLFDYTVIGDHVNIASRLEGVNKVYRTSILLSEYTYQHVQKNAFVREVDFIRVVGRSEPLRIYELLGMDTLPQINKDYQLEVFDEALKAYRSRQFSVALKRFHRVLRYFPNDGPAQVYTIRCLNYIESPPPEGWTGIHDVTNK